jgi:hypothetical protein
MDLGKMIIYGLLYTHLGAVHGGVQVLEARSLCDQKANKRIHVFVAFLDEKYRPYFLIGR